MAGKQRYTSSLFVQSGSVAQFFNGIEVGDSVNSANLNVLGTVSATSFTNLSGDPITGGPSIKLVAGTVEGVNQDISQDHFINITTDNYVSETSPNIVQNGIVSIKAKGIDDFTPDYFNFVKIGNDGEAAVTVQQGTSDTYTPSSEEERTAGTHRYLIYAAETGAGGETHQVYHTVTLRAFVNAVPTIKPNTGTSFTLQPEHDSIEASVTLHFTESFDENHVSEDNNEIGQDYISDFTITRNTPQGTTGTQQYSLALTNPESSQTTIDGLDAIQVTSDGLPGLSNSSSKLTLGLNLTNYANEFSNINHIGTHTNLTEPFTATITDAYTATDTGDYSVIVKAPPVATIENITAKFNGDNTTLTHTLLYDSTTLSDNTQYDSRYHNDIVKLKLNADITEPGGITVDHDHSTIIRVLRSTTSTIDESDATTETLGYFKFAGNQSLAYQFSDDDTTYSNLDVNDQKLLTGIPIPGGVSSQTYYIGGTTVTADAQNSSHTKHGDHNHHVVTPNSTPSTLIINRCPNVLIQDIELEVESSFNSEVKAGENNRIVDLVYGLDETLLTNEINTYFPDNSIDNYNTYIDQSRVRVRIKAKVIEPFGPDHNNIRVKINAKESGTTQGSTNFIHLTKNTTNQSGTINSFTSEYTTEHGHPDASQEGKELLVSTYVSEFMGIKLPSGNFELSPTFYTSAITSTSVTQDSVTSTSTIQVNPVPATTFSNLVTEIETHGHSNIGTTNSLRTVLYGNSRKLNKNSSSFSGHDQVALYSSQSVARFRVKGTITEPPGPAQSTFDSQIVHLKSDGTKANMATKVTIDPSNPVSSDNGTLSSSITTIDPNTKDKITTFITSWEQGGHQLATPANSNRDYSIGVTPSQNFNDISNNANYTTNTTQILGSPTTTFVKVFDTEKTEIEIQEVEIETSGNSNVAAGLNSSNTSFPGTHIRSILPGETTTRATSQNASDLDSVSRTRIKAVVTEPIGPLHHNFTRIATTYARDADPNRNIFTVESGDLAETSHPSYFGVAVDNSTFARYSDVAVSGPRVENGILGFNKFITNQGTGYDSGRENRFTGYLDLTNLMELAANTDTRIKILKIEFKNRGADDSQLYQWGMRIGKSNGSNIDLGYGVYNDTRIDGDSHFNSFATYLDEDGYNENFKTVGDLVNANLDAKTITLPQEVELETANGIPNSLRIDISWQFARFSSFGTDPLDEDVSDHHLVTRITFETISERQEIDANSITGPQLTFSTSSANMSSIISNYVNGRLQTSYISDFIGKELTLGQYNLTVAPQGNALNNTVHAPTSENGFIQINSDSSNFIKVEDSAPLLIEGVEIISSVDTSQILHGKSSTETNTNLNDTYPNVDSRNQLVQIYVKASIQKPAIGKASATITITGQDDDFPLSITLEEGSSDINGFTDDGDFIIFTSKFFPLKLSANPSTTSDGLVVTNPETKTFTLSAAVTSFSVDGGSSLFAASSATKQITVTGAQKSDLNISLNTSKLTSSKFNTSDSSDSVYYTFPPGNSGYAGEKYVVVDNNLSVVEPTHTIDDSITFGTGQIRLDYTENHSNYRFIAATNKTSTPSKALLYITNPGTRIISGSVTVKATNLLTGNGKDKDTKTIYTIPATAVSMSTDDTEQRKSFHNLPTLTTGLLAISSHGNYSGSAPSNPQGLKQVNYIVDVHNGSSTDYTFDLNTHNGVNYFGSYTTSERAFNHGDKGTVSFTVNNGTSNNVNLSTRFNAGNKTSNQSAYPTTQGGLTVNKVYPFNNVYQNLKSYGTSYPYGFQAWDADVSIPSKPRDGYNFLDLQHTFSDSTTNQRMKTFEWYYNDSNPNTTANLNASTELSHSTGPNTSLPIFSISGVSYLKKDIEFTSSIMGITNLVGKTYPHNSHIMFTQNVYNAQGTLIIKGDSKTQNGNQQLLHEVHDISHPGNRRGLRWVGGDDESWVPLENDTANIHVVVKAISLPSAASIDSLQGFKDFNLSYTQNSNLIGTRNIGRFMYTPTNVNGYQQSTNHIRYFYDEDYRWKQTTFLSNSKLDKANFASFWLNSSNADYDSSANILSTTDLQQTLQGRLVYPSTNYTATLPNIVNYSSATGDRVYYAALQVPNTTGQTTSFVIKVFGDFAFGDIWGNPNSTNSLDGLNIRMDVRTPGVEGGDAGSGWSNPARNAGSKNTTQTTLNTSNGTPTGATSWKSFQSFTGGVSNNQLSSGGFVQIRVNLQDRYIGDYTNGIVLLKVRLKEAFTGYISKIELAEDV